MTVDERIEQLAVRQEALAQSVELLVHSQREFVDQQRTFNSKNQELMAHMMESIDSLARIAHGHERRISDIERGQH